MNLQDISTQLLYTTAPIWTEYNDGKTASATSFIFALAVAGEPERSIPLLVTNYHVIRDAKKALVELVESEGDKPARDKRVRVELDRQLLARYVDKADDLALIPFAPILQQLEAIGKKVFFRSINAELVPSAEVIENLAALEEITFIGYPSGLRDERNATPLLRRGITATPVWNDFGGQPAFLVDAGVFPGSSGSPVFLFNQGSYTSGSNVVIGSRLLFLGVISKSVIRPTQGAPGVFLGLGKVVKSHRVRSLAETVARPLVAKVT